LLGPLFGNSFSPPAGSSTPPDHGRTGAETPVPSTTPSQTPSAPTQAPAKSRVPLLPRANSGSADTNSPQQLGHE
jgi:hypothetical protein